MNLILIRHSESLVNPYIPIPTWGLSDEGVMRAKNLQKHIQKFKVEVVYSSLQTKALETAILATKNLGISIKIDNRLTETTSFTNKFVPYEELLENVKKYDANENVSIHGGETSKEALKRFNDSISTIVQNEKDKKNIAVVSHGNVLAYFSTQYVDEDTRELQERMMQPDVAIFDLKSKKFSTFFGDVKVF